MRKQKFTANPDRKELLSAVNFHMEVSLGKNPQNASLEDYHLALAMAIREPVIRALNATDARVRSSGAKQIHYLSMEFQIGRLLGNSLCNLGLYDTCAEAADELGIKLVDILESETDPALGNGGLGRLAACFLDSLVSMSYPGYGYGINYQFGLFRQSFANGFQHEQPDNWAVHGTPWHIERRDQSSMIPLYGRIDSSIDAEGQYEPHWLGWNTIIGVPSDIPAVGFGGTSVNFLRLYTASAPSEFDMAIFNGGDYLRAMEHQVAVETVSKVLYPSDSAEAGRELRFIQEYFFVSCAMRDIFKRHISNGHNVTEFSQHNAIQLNDTHPTLAVAELMRTLIDEHSLSWDNAWEITQRTTVYTNHTLLPEALERWSAALFEKVLPRHLQIVYEINRRFLAEVELKHPMDAECLERMSIVQEHPRKEIRMAHLAIVGSHSINGVAEMHSDSVKKTLVPDFYDLWPQRFNNKTNGVTPRRWLLNCNNRLATLISEALGREWIEDLDQLIALESLAKDSSFVQNFKAIKRANKVDLAQRIRSTTGITVNPDSMFDVQIKRIHEYKHKVSVAEAIVPAADLSEQISTAG